MCRPLLLLYSVLLFGLFQAQEINGQDFIDRTPADITMEFIADYKAYNEFALASDAKHQGKKDHLIEKRYRKLIRKYCGAKNDYQGVTWGTISNHDARYEKVVNLRFDEDITVIVTKYFDEQNPFREADYEYHYRFKNKKWVLVEVYYIDQDGPMRHL
ncbi:hypothetical protein ABV409_09660 [Flagellimonas sp. DF-77]|uniref:hypothetical protein n=1 Tax=Flagellimonas algarum TaxID=3230298 RepID=UPI003394C3FC